MSVLSARTERWWLSRAAGTVAMLALLVAFSCGTPAAAPEKKAAEKKEAAKKPDLYETEPAVIKQGGYVEKLEPGVDYKDRLPRILPLEPAESIKGMHIIPGFRLQQVATEPLIADAVDVAFDENGRLFVCEMIPYAQGGTSQFGSPDGRVSMLEDRDGDGRFETRTIYVDKLVWPTGVACFDGGVFIASAPDLLYSKDTDGDGRADVRKVVLTGFSTANPNALPNSLRFGLDNRLHGMTSTAGGRLDAVMWNEGAESKKVAPIESRGRDFCVDPRSGQLWLESGGSQFGMTYDDWGAKFESSNSAPIEMVMYEDRYIARNPFLAAPPARIRAWVHGMTVYPTAPPEPWRVVRTEMRMKGAFSGPVEGGGKPGGYFTAACGVMIYKGDAWPEAFRGNAFVCEGAGNLVHRMKLSPDGIAYQADRTEQGREFWTSDEVWFRPIQFTNGPDGNLYLADMYREVFEHPDAVPPSAKKYIDITTGKDRGRVYRIEREDYKPGKPARLGGKSTAELVPLLAHANYWHRSTSARLLFERQDRTAVEPLRKLAADCPAPLGRMHAMYAMDGLGALDEAVLLPRLADEHPRVREHAVRLSERLVAASPAVRERLYRMVSDEDLRVRYQLAFTLGEIPGTQSTRALAAIAARDTGDRWVRLAVLSSSLGRAGELFALLTDDSSWRTGSESIVLLEQLAEQAGLQKHADQVAEVLRVLDGLPAGEKKVAQAAVRGLGRGLEKSGNPLRAQLGAGSRAGRLLGEMIAQAKQTAGDEEKPVERRVEAVRSLVMTSYEQSGGLLGRLLDGRQPQEVQKAALQTLSRFREPEVADKVVAAWGGFSPAVRGEAAEALFARNERLAVLLAAVEKGVILPSQLDPARIQFLLAHPDETVRKKALELLGSAKLARREDVVAAHRDVLKMSGDAARGKAVFKRECSTCHKLEGVGYELGLPLNTVQNRGRETILLSVLDPNRDVQPQYLNYVIVTDDGLSKTGMITSETATSITLTRAEGESDTVLRNNIDELVNTGLSIMPEGLEKQLTRQEMADAIEYLMSLP